MISFLLLPISNGNRMGRAYFWNIKIFNVNKIFRAWKLNVLYFVLNFALFCFHFVIMYKLRDPDVVQKWERQINYSRVT